MNDDNQIPEASIQAALQSDDGANPAPQTDNNQQDWGHPGTPTDDTPAQAPAETPAADNPAPAMPAPESTGDPLQDTKQKAISDLSPLLQHLDQTPEDKFRTTMMMLQATDNKDLIPAAYEAASAIPDEKAKAQALLDVINEVNYFTHSGHHEHA